MRNDLQAAVDGLVSLQSYIETDYQEKYGEDYENVLGYAEDMNAFDTALTALTALRGPEWVRTADRLPLHFSNTLVVMGGKITLGLYDCNCWFFYNEDKNKWEMDEYDRVTHWMPLPKLPEVEG